MIDCQLSNKPNGRRLNSNNFSGKFEKFVNVGGS